jgi:hypothetical protein
MNSRSPKFSVSNESTKFLTGGNAMSKTKSIIRVLISSAVISFLLSGCGGNDNPTGPTENDMVGTWELIKLTIIAGQTTVLTEGQLNQMGAYWILELNSDNTFDSNYNLDALENETGTWSASGDELLTKVSKRDYSENLPDNSPGCLSATSK